MKRFSCLSVVLLSILFFSCGIKQLDDNIYGSIGLKLSSKVTNQILGNLADEDSGYDKIDVKVEVSGDFADSQIQTVQMTEEIEPVKFVFEKIPAKSVVTVTCTISISGTDTVLYEGKSEAFTILANEVQNVKITLHPADIGVEELEPTVEIELPEIEIVFNADVKSYSLIKVFDEIFLADKSVENYNKYSVCKSYAVSDELIQFVINNWDSSYAVKLNKTELKVTEDGKLELAEVVKNLAAGKNTVAIVKDEEVIDSVEFPVENGIYDCQEPVLKVNDLVIKGGDKIRYGIKAGVPEKVNLAVVQADGTEFDKRVETTYDLSGSSFTVEDDTIVLPEKAKNTYKVKFAVKVPEEYRDPNGTYEAAASFTTSYDVDTGYVFLSDYYTLKYSSDGTEFKKILGDLVVHSFCFDEYGNFYYSYGDDVSGNTVVKKYDVSKSLSSDVISDITTQWTRLAYDFENSLLYIYCYMETPQSGQIICVDTVNTEHKSYNCERNILEINEFDQYIAVKDGYLYFIKGAYYNGVDSYKLYKYSMKLDNTTQSCTLTEEKVVKLADYILSVTNSTRVNDMVLVGDDIYIAVEANCSEYVGASKTIKLESRGGLVKYNTITDQIEVFGWDFKEPEPLQPTLYAWAEINDGGTFLSSNCSLSVQKPSPKNGSNTVVQLYSDEQLSTPVSTKDISIFSYTPSKNEKDYFREVKQFVAIKPKKLVVSESGMFIYSDDDGLHGDSTGAFVTVDLEKFSIGDITENTMLNTHAIDQCLFSSSLSIWNDCQTVHYKYNTETGSKSNFNPDFNISIPNESYN